MKYCVAIGKTTSSTAPLPLAGDFIESMRTAREMGFHAVEIHTPEPDSLDIGAIRAACVELDMFVATLGTGMIYGKYGLSLMETDPERRRTIIGMVKQYVDIAADIGSKVTIGSIKGNVKPGESRDDMLAIMGECLSELSEYAVSKGVTLLLEATNRYENNVLNTGRDVRDMIERHALKNVQALMDSFHINIEERSPSAGLVDAGEYLGHIHFADNTRWYPGAGAFDFGAFRDAIAAVGYDGVLSAEAFPLPDGPTAARESAAFFRKYFG